MMWILYIGLLLIIARISYRIWQRSIDAEMHSGKSWFMQRVPFSRAKYEKNYNDSDARNKIEYDPEADYESLEVFYRQSSVKKDKE